MYQVIKNQENQRNEDNGNTLNVFVDSEFASTTNFKQIEMFAPAFEYFQIIVSRDLATLINMNKSLNHSLYSIVEVRQNAQELFTFSTKLEKSNLNELKEEVQSYSKDSKLLRHLIEFDPISLQTRLSSVSKVLDALEESQYRLTEGMSKLVEENKLLKNNYNLLLERFKEVETNREELLDSNLKLKFNGYIDELRLKEVEITTPILYIKAPLVKDVQGILKYFDTLRYFLRNKYNKNICNIVIDDPNALKMRKLDTSYTYCVSNGSYNMNMGDKIITTSKHIIPLMESFEKFAGVKDLFIFIDITPSNYIFVVSEGTLVYIRNEEQTEKLTEGVDGIFEFKEDELMNETRNLDELNLKLFLPRSDKFKELEDITVSLM